MKKKYLFFIFLIIIALCAILYRRIDVDKSWTLPVTQRINLSLQKIGLSTGNSSVDHVVVIVMENKSYSDIVGSKNAPYINTLIQKYSFANNYHAVSHPSLPNYIAILGGNTFGITSDCTDCHINSSNLVNQLEQAHKTWKAYMESMPSACFIGNAYPYDQKHNPFIYFDNIRNNQNRCRSIVPYTEISSDFKSIQTTPDFAWITPNMCSDMHDCSVAKGDAWLAKQIPLILQSPAFTNQKSLLVLTWDEGEGSGSNQIPTILIGNSVKQGFISHTPYTHYSLLHTIENIWGLAPLTINTQNSPIINDIFK